MPSIETLKYGRRIVSGLSFDAAVDRAKTFLKDEGFGVLCEIDVTATMQEKLGESFRPYRILGACNPKLAHRALSAEPQVGLLLPCNVVVQVLDGDTVVSAVDAEAMMAFVGNRDLSQVADEANAALGRVLSRIAEAGP
ncbi:MAG: DUF302 domain-containing protein [Vulcanimicrobiaceae bacterium]